MKVKKCCKNGILYLDEEFTKPRYLYIKNFKTAEDVTHIQITMHLQDKVRYFNMMRLHTHSPTHSNSGSERVFSSNSFFCRSTYFPKNF